MIVNNVIKEKIVMRKILSLVIALIFSMSIVAFAEEKPGSDQETSIEKIRESNRPQQSSHVSSHKVKKHKKIKKTKNAKKSKSHKRHKLHQ